ncbi:DUF2442 domain-containing protein [Aggregatilinea lenta]|uniref:DUF2442 domain-containing protein n=1 Tax=Aggregatilinea lenta TaxID=913108 RepID=UPI000E5C276C|nr:DUF2442 domain-containing protein [Aggregatilinea lenta]
MSDQSPREEDRPVAVETTSDMLRVTLADGRIIATPLNWYPRLANATPEQRAVFELSRGGVHWPDLDEDLSVAGMLRGNRPAQPHHTSTETHV